MSEKYNRCPNCPQTRTIWSEKITKENLWKSRWANNTESCLNNCLVAKAACRYRSRSMNPDVILWWTDLCLDPNVGEVLKIMKELAQEGLTMIVVTHEMEFALEMSLKWVIFMDKESLLKKVNLKLSFTQPKEERTREFLNAILNDLKNTW